MNVNMRCLRGKTKNNNIAIWMLILYVYILAIFTRNVLTQDLQAIEEEEELAAYDENDESDPNLNAWCFRFTWLGPKYDRNYKTFLNQTCKDILKLNKGIPCVTPLIVTNNSNYPDTDWIWEQHKHKPSDIACKAAGGDICAKYSYFFNGRIENVTYLCTKVNIENGTSPTRGCYKEVRNNRVTEVCICEPRVGQMPCNTATPAILSHNLIVFVTIICISFALFKMS